MQIFVYECAEAPANHRFVARFFLDGKTMPVFHHGSDREAVERRAREWLDSEIAKHRPGKRKSLTARKPSADPTTETDASAGQERNENINLPKPENRGDDMGHMDEDDLIG